ncbi:MAG: chemotaxis protein CheC [Clostridiales bacterium]|nr:chemotaxis protein CheC [Clostridiales bacterium]
MSLAKSLSTMLGGSLGISKPKVRALDHEGLVDALGSTDGGCVAVTVRYNGDASGSLVFLLGREDAEGIAGILVDGTCGDDGDGNSAVPGDISELGLSAIKEMGNMLGSAYLGVVSTLTGLAFDMSTPCVDVGVAGAEAALAVPMAEFSTDDGKPFIIEECFSAGKRDFKNYMVLFADIPFEDEVLSKLAERT